MKNNKIAITLFSCLLLAGCNNSSSDITNTDTDIGGTDSSTITTTSVDSSTDSSNDSSSNSSSNTFELNDLMSVVSNASKKASLISKGRIVLTESNTYSEPSTKTMNFEFGKDKNGDVLHYTDYDWNDNVVDSYVMKTASGSIIAVSKDSSGFISKQFTEYEKVDYIYQYLLGYGEGDFYGTEGLLSGLTAYLEKNVNKDAKFGFANEVYSFSFGYFASLDTSEYFVVDSNFEVGESDEIIELDVQVDSYNQGSFLVDDELGTIYLVDGASPSSSKKYEISQVVGSRTFTNPINLENFFATSFDLMYNGSKVEEGSTIEMEVGSDASLTLENVLPTTFSPNFDSITVEVLSGDEDSFSGNYNTWSNEISLSSTSTGEFEVRVSSANVSKTFKVNVSAAQPKEIFASYFVEGPDGYVAYSLGGGTISAYAGITYVFAINVNPFQADQSIDSTVKSDGLKYTLETKSIKTSEIVDEKDMLCFTPLNEGSYDLVIQSASKADVKLTIHFDVVKTPSFQEVLSSDYAWRQGSQIKYYLSFTPDVSSVGQSGHVTITDKTSNKQENATYSISSISNGYEFTFNHVDGEEFNLTIKMSKDFKMFVYVDNFANEMNKVTVEFMLTGGSWEGTSGDYTFSLSLFNTGEASVMLSNADYTVSEYMSCNFAISESESGYTGTLSANEYTNDPFIALPASFTVNSELSSIGINFDYNGASYSFTLAMSSDY